MRVRRARGVAVLVVVVGRRRGWGWGRRDRGGRGRGVEGGVIIGLRGRGLEMVRSEWMHVWFSIGLGFGVLNWSLGGRRVGGFVCQIWI